MTKQVIKENIIKEEKDESRFKILLNRVIEFK